MVVRLRKLCRRASPAPRSGATRRAWSSSGAFARIDGGQPAAARVGSAQLADPTRAAAGLTRHRIGANAPLKDQARVLHFSAQESSAGEAFATAPPRQRARSHTLREEPASCRRRRQRRDIDELFVAFDKEMVVLGYVGIEIGLRAVDGDLAEQPTSVNWCRVL